MLAKTGFKYRLEPTPTQLRCLRAHAGACRWLWNHFLSFRDEAYSAARAAGGAVPKGAFGYAWLCRELTLLRKTTPWLKDTSVSALQQTLRDFNQAFANFFAGTHRYPTRKKRGSDSFRVVAPRDVSVDSDWVNLPKLGWVRFRLSRKIPGRVVNATVSTDGRHWFVSFCAEHGIQPGTPVGEPIGIDLGIARSITVSDGRVFNLPVPTSREAAFVKRLHRLVSRKTKGSARRRRAVARLAKWRRHLANRRRDAAHKITSMLATEHREIHVEDLRLSNMTRSASGTIEEPGTNVRQKAGLNRSLLAQAHGETIRFLEYKLPRTGGTLVKKNPAYSSQKCSECGHIAAENRHSQAVFCCLKCANQLNADHNAAINILEQPAGGLPVAARRRIRRKSPSESRTLLKPWNPPKGRQESAAIAHSA